MSKSTDKNDIRNWLTQIKKGYLELCVMSLIFEKEKLYGFQLIGLMAEFDLNVKEGTLYPLLSRMSNDDLLKAHWDTQNVKGHPRKFYSLTKNGVRTLKSMQDEYENMYKTYLNIRQSGGIDEKL